MLHPIGASSTLALIPSLVLQLICYRVVSQRKGGAQWDVSDDAYERPFTEVHTDVFPSSSTDSVTLPAGEHIWPFSFALPESFRYSSDDKEYALPPTFHQRGLPEFIHYKLSAVVKRKGWSKLNYLYDPTGFRLRSVWIDILHSD